MVAAAYFLKLLSNVRFGAAPKQSGQSSQSISPRPGRSASVTDIGSSHPEW